MSRRPTTRPWLRLLSAACTYRGLGADAGGHVFIVLVFSPLIMSENDWSTLLSSIPATVFTWLLAVFITCKRRSPREG